MLLYLSVNKIEMKTLKETNAQKQEQIATLNSLLDEKNNLLKKHSMKRTKHNKL